MTLIDLSLCGTLENKSFDLLDSHLCDLTSVYFLSCGLLLGLILFYF